MLLERDAQLGVLRELLAAALSGQGRVVAVAGEAGAGKTSLVQAFLAESEGRAAILRSACEDMTIPVPLGPLYDLARDAGFDMGSFDGGIEQRLPLFARVRELLSHFELPSLLIVEDIHWADDATLDFIRYLGRRIATDRTLLVLTARNDASDGRKRLRRALGDIPPDNLCRIEVPLLSEAAVRMLAEQAGRDSASVYRASAGNAFYVTELLRSNAAGLPQSVLDATLVRAERLTVAERNALDAVSVFPRRGEARVLDAMLGQSGAAELAGCVEAGMLEADGSSYARLHALRKGLFRPSEETLTLEVYDAVLARLDEHGLSKPHGRATLAARITAEIERHFPQDPMIARIVTALLDYEEVFLVPNIDWSERRSVSELWTLRDALKVQKALLDDFDRVVDLITITIGEVLVRVISNIPDVPAGDDAAGGITVPTSKLDMLANFGSVIEVVMACCFESEVERRELFPRLRRKLEANFILASGGNPNDPKGFSRAPRPPTKSDITDRHELVETYLGGTPLMNLFEGSVPFTIPAATRFEHHHIVAGSGHGKTQTLQYLIANDLKAVARGAASIVVLDSQGDLIKTISQLKVFAAGEPLHDRICIIDPTDVEYPVSLNLFDVGIDRLQSYPLLERERLTNSILELYDYVLGTLLSAEMTQKQNVIFRYVTRLMLHIPDATIHTLRELMEPGSERKFAPHIAKLSGTARQFFETEFSSREFNDTKKQVLRRLWGILENQTFERMFSHPRSKLDLFAEMNVGKAPIPEPWSGRPKAPQTTPTLSMSKYSCRRLRRTSTMLPLLLRRSFRRSSRGCHEGGEPGSPSRAASSISRPWRWCGPGGGRRHQLRARQVCVPSRRRVA